MAPADLPEGVQDALKNHKRIKTGLELAQQKVKKKLAEIPGAEVAGQPIPLVKNKCGECQGCRVKNTCGTCRACQALPAASTRKQLQDGDREACLDPDRRCIRWPVRAEARSVISGSSGGSATTPASLKLCMEALTSGLQQLSDATADLNFALEAAGEGPWEGCPLLTTDEMVKQLENQQDMVDDLLERGETR